MKTWTQIAEFLYEGVNMGFDFKDFREDSNGRIWGLVSSECENYFQVELLPNRRVIMVCIIKNDVAVYEILNHVIDWIMENPSKYTIDCGVLKEI
jgi:hypothetical protein